MEDTKLPEDRTGLPRGHTGADPVRPATASPLAAVIGRWKWILAAALVAFVLYRFKFAPTAVKAVSAELGPVVAEVLGTGTLEARVKTTISSRIQERLAEVLVDQGDSAAAGQLLARLDDGELRLQVEIADAGLVAARSTLDRVKTEEARALAVVRQAQLEHERFSRLLTNQISSQADFDKTDEQLKVAEADLKRVRAAIAEAQNQVVSAEKNLSYQRERLDYTRILCPYDGLVVRRDRDPGGVVVPGGSILQLISTNEMWVSAWVDETVMAGLAVGQPARVVFRSEPGRDYPGEVARLGRETDRETREFLVDVRLKELPRNWTVGQRAETFIETGRKPRALCIPQRFVQWRTNWPGVFVNSGGRARWRTIALGLRGRETVEVTQGLTAGDVVVTTREPSQAPLTEGRRVAAP